MSFDSITVLPRSSAKARAAWWVASSVSRPRMISISPITGTGEKKCRPMNRSARSVAVASPVMLMLLVLLAKIVSGSARSADGGQVSRFSASSSKTASITMSWPATPSVPSAVAMRRSVSSAAACSSLPFATWRSRLPAIRLEPFSAQLGGAIGERHRLAGGGADLGDAVAHQAGADDVDPFDAHGRLAYQPQQHGRVLPHPDHRSRRSRWTDTAPAPVRCAHPRSGSGVWGRHCEPWRPAPPAALAHAAPAPAHLDPDADLGDLRVHEAVSPDGRRRTAGTRRRRPVILHLGHHAGVAVAPSRPGTARCPGRSAPARPVGGSGRRQVGRGGEHAPKKGFVTRHARHGRAGRARRSRAQGSSAIRDVHEAAHNRSHDRSDPCSCACVRCGRTSCPPSSSTRS